MWRRGVLTGRRFRTSALAGCAVVALATLAACIPIEDQVIQPRDPSLTGRVLSYEGNDQYGLALSGSTVVASGATSNTGQNTRITFSPADATPLADEQSCATWSSQTTGHDQQGAALRMIAADDGTTKGLTVTKNIWYAGNWIFNVHTWDTSQSQVFTQIGQFDLGTVFRQGNYPIALPWSICARVVDNTLSFIVWPTDQAQPAWDDPNYGGSVTLPSAGTTPVCRAGTSGTWPQRTRPCSPRARQARCRPPLGLRPGSKRPRQRLRPGPPPPSRQRRSEREVGGQTGRSP